MHSENEMTVLSATGFGPKQVFKITMVPVFVMMLLIGFLSLYLAPIAASNLEIYLEKQQQESEFSFITPGRFNALGKNGSKVSYSETLSSDRKQMQNVFMADGNTLILAKSGSQYVSTKTGSRFLALQQGKRFSGVPGEAEFEAMTFTEYSVKIAEESAVAKKARYNAVTTASLLERNEPIYKAQLHYRIGLFLLIPIIVIIGFPLSHVKPRAGRYGKVIPAIVIYMVYYTTLITARKWMEQGDTPEWMGLWWLHGIFLILGLALMYWPTLVLKWNGRKRRAMAAKINSAQSPAVEKKGAANA
jgi:lipopolysaccharide export system permease protein